MLKNEVRSFRNFHSGTRLFIRVLLQAFTEACSPMALNGTVYSVLKYQPRAW